MSGVWRDVDLRLVNKRHGFKRDWIPCPKVVKSVCNLIEYLNVKGGGGGDYVIVKSQMKFLTLIFKI